VAPVKVVVDAQRCQGHNRCAALAPELFAIDDLGYAQAALTDHLDGAQLASARLAAANCPEHAIRIED